MQDFSGSDEVMCNCIGFNFELASFFIVALLIFAIFFSLYKHFRVEK